MPYKSGFEQGINRKINLKPACILKQHLSWSRQQRKWKQIIRGSDWITYRVQCPTQSYYAITSRVALDLHSLLHEDTVFSCGSGQINSPPSVMHGALDPSCLLSFMRCWAQEHLYLIPYAYGPWFITPLKIIRSYQRLGRSYCPRLEGRSVRRTEKVFVIGVGRTGTGAFLRMEETVWILGKRIYLSSYTTSHSGWPWS